jgi:hypothetical protein
MHTSAHGLLHTVTPSCANLRSLSDELSTVRARMACSRGVRCSDRVVMTAPIIAFPPVPQRATAVQMVVSGWCPPCVPVTGAYKTGVVLPPRLCLDVTCPLGFVHRTEHHRDARRHAGAGGSRVDDLSVGQDARAPMAHVYPLATTHCEERGDTV